MAWSHISNGDVVFAGNATATTVWPSHSTGNQGVLCVNLEEDSGATTPTPSGWNLLDDFAANTGRINVFIKVATTAAEANVEVAMSGSDGGDIQACAIAVFAGGTVDIDAAAVHTSEVFDELVPFGSYTPTVANTLILIATGVGAHTANSLGNPVGFTSAFYGDNAGGQDSGVGLKFQIQTDASAITGTDMTAEADTGSQTTIFALKAAAVAAAGGLLLRRRHLA